MVDTIFLTYLASPLQNQNPIYVGAVTKVANPIFIKDDDVKKCD